MRFRHLILIFGIWNACLYSALLPLWEGFDEPFHYSYIETLWQTRRLPVLGRTQIAADVFQSFSLAPDSYLVNSWKKNGHTYEAWEKLPRGEKQHLRRELETLRPEREKNGDGPNYEAHQGPLAYLILAPVDGILASFSLTTRVLILRLLAGTCAVVLLFIGAGALCRNMLLPEVFANAALFTIFCSQMLYAAVAHVANDWLAVGISALFLAALVTFASEQNRRTALTAALWLALGLLTKAYFLVFGALAAVVAVVLICRRRVDVKTLTEAALLVLAMAGPWYLRNFILYRNLTGTYEAFRGIGFREVLAAIPRMDWFATTGFLARSSLWTGNASFTAFSRITLNLVLLVLCLTLFGWVWRRRLVRPVEWILFIAVVLFSAAIAYDSAASFVLAGVNNPGASPWYAQVLLAPVLILAYLGASRWRRPGAVLATATLALWAWILISSWTIKLFPLYSGNGAGPMRIRDIRDWYTHGAAAHLSDLSLLALAPAGLLYAALLVVLVLTIGLSAAIIRQIWSASGNSI